MVRESSAEDGVVVEAPLLAVSSRRKTTLTEICMVGTVLRTRLVIPHGDIDHILISTMPGWTPFNRERGRLRPDC